MMKKMMMILAALSAVTLAQAAAIKWTSGELYKPGVTPAELVDDGHVWGYLFLIDATTYGSLANPEAVHDLFDTKDKTFNGNAAKVQKMVEGGYMTLKTDGHTPDTYYAAVVYEFFSSAVGGEGQKPLTGMGAAEATHWIANTATVTIGGSANKTKGNLAVNWHGGAGEAFGDNTTGALGWDVVPEPMCAALLALGAAVLGLRRKRS